MFAGTCVNLGLLLTLLSFPRGLLAIDGNKINYSALSFYLVNDAILGINWRHVKGFPCFKEDQH